MRVFALLMLLPLAAAGCSGNPATPTARKFEAVAPLLTKDLTPTAARARLGPADEETGSGLMIYIYNLEDGRRLWLGFPGARPIVYARLEEPSGVMKDLELR